MLPRLVLAHCGAHLLPAFIAQWVIGLAAIFAPADRLAVAQEINSGDEFSQSGKAISIITSPPN